MEASLADLAMFFVFNTGMFPRLILNSGASLA